MLDQNTVLGCSQRLSSRLLRSAPLMKKCSFSVTLFRDSWGVQTDLQDNNYLLLRQLEKVLNFCPAHFFVVNSGSQLTFRKQLKKVIIFCPIHFFVYNRRSQLTFRTQLIRKCSFFVPYTFSSLTGVPTDPLDV